MAKPYCPQDDSITLVPARDRVRPAGTYTSQEVAPMKDMTRREFLETGGKAAVGVGLGVAAAGALAAPARAQARRAGANDKIVMGLIGCGGQGRSVMSQHMGHPDVEFVAVCDVDSR